MENIQMQNISANQPIAWCGNLHVAFNIYDQLQQFRPSDADGEDNVAKHTPLPLLGTVFVVMNLPAAQ